MCAGQGLAVCITQYLEGRVVRANSDVSRLPPCSRASRPATSKIIQRATGPYILNPDYCRDLQVLLSQYYKEVLDLKGSVEFRRQGNSKFVAAMSLIRLHPA